MVLTLQWNVAFLPALFRPRSCDVPLYVFARRHAGFLRGASVCATCGFLRQGPGYMVAGLQGVCYVQRLPRLGFLASPRQSCVKPNHSLATILGAVLFVVYLADLAFCRDVFGGHLTQLDFKHFMQPFCHRCICHQTVIPASPGMKAATFLGFCYTTQADHVHPESQKSMHWRQPCFAFAKVRQFPSHFSYPSSNTEMGFLLGPLSVHFLRSARAISISAFFSAFDGAWWH